MDLAMLPIPLRALPPQPTRYNLDPRVLMKRFFVLLPLLFLASVAFAAPGLKPGGFAEFNVELPRDLRLVAGRGQLSPVAHALVTIAAPANLDMAREWP